MGAEMSGPAIMGFSALPHNQAAEQALLGAMMMDPATLDALAHSVSVDHFFVPAHGRIFAAMLALRQSGQVPTPITLRTQFADDADLEGVGGVRYLADLAANVVSRANAEGYARTLADLYQRRMMVRIGQDIIDRAGRAADDISSRDLLEQALSGLYAVESDGADEAEPVSLMDAAQAQLTHLDGVFHGHGGMPTGIDALDSWTGGMQRAELWVIGGRPGMGKSVSGLSIALNAARAGTRTLFYSAEMPAKQLGGRALAQETGWSTKAQRHMAKAQNADVFPRLGEAMRTFRNVPLWIDPKPRRTVEDIARLARRRWRKRRRDETGGIRQGLDLLVVDYLGLMGVSRGLDRETKTSRIEHITTSLKALAKDLDIAVILLSQLNRESGKRDNPRPVLSDLRDSGAIEQDADLVILLHREDEQLRRDEPQRKAGETDAKFNDRYDHWQSRMRSCHGRIDLIIEKFREGETGTITARFDGARSVIEDLAPEETAREPIYSAYTPALPSEPDPDHPALMGLGDAEKEPF